MSMTVKEFLKYVESPEYKEYERKLYEVNPGAFLSADLVKSTDPQPPRYQSILEKRRRIKRVRKKNNKFKFIFR